MLLVTIIISFNNGLLFNLFTSNARLHNRDILSLSLSPFVERKKSSSKDHDANETDSEVITAQTPLAFNTADSPETRQTNRPPLQCAACSLGETINLDFTANRLFTHTHRFKSFPMNCSLREREHKHKTTKQFRSFKILFSKSIKRLSRASRCVFAQNFKIAFRCQNLFVDLKKPQKAATFGSGSQH